MATALIGTILGALVAGKPVDKFGRKKVLFAIGILYFVGALGTAFVSNLVLFQLFRFLGGIGVGVASVVAPIYTAEIAPPKLAAGWSASCSSTSFSASCWPTCRTSSSAACCPSRSPGAGCSR